MLSDVRDARYEGVLAVPFGKGSGTIFRVILRPHSRSPFAKETCTLWCQGEHSTTVLPGRTAATRGYPFPATHPRGPGARKGVMDEAAIRDLDTTSALADTET
jgi:hypothetical protein